MTAKKGEEKVGLSEILLTADDVRLVKAAQSEPSPSRLWLIATCFAAGLIVWRTALFCKWDLFSRVLDKPSCIQQPPLIPHYNILTTLESIYAEESFQNRSAAWLSGAIRIP